MGANESGLPGRAAVGFLGSLNRRYPDPYPATPSDRRPAARLACAERTASVKTHVHFARLPRRQGTRFLGTELLPAFIRENYEIHEWRHATAVLASDFRAEFEELVDVLTRFRWYTSWVNVGGGRKSKVSEWIDGELAKHKWAEKKFDTEIVVDEARLKSPTHSVDCFKNGVALEIEWNNKDPFYDRDLNNFRLLFDLRVVSVGVIVTRCDHLQGIFKALGQHKKYGASTTHMSKLLPRIEGGGGGGCPLLVLGISERLYVEDAKAAAVKEAAAQNDEDDQE